MKITKIAGTESTSSKSFNSFMEELKGFENAFLKRLQTCIKCNEKQGTDSNKLELCETCNLEFYYYYSKSGGFRNGIWIKVKNEIWIRVHTDLNGKKINVFTSKESLICSKYVNYLTLSWIKSYSLPEKFDSKGCYMSHEGRKADPDLSWNDIITEIGCLLFYLCHAK